MLITIIPLNVYSHTYITNPNTHNTNIPYDMSKMTQITYLSHYSIISNPHQMPTLYLQINHVTTKIISFSSYY